MPKFHIFTSVILALSLHLMSCSVQTTATKQTSGSVPMPEYPSTEGGFFAVSQTEGSRTFTGTLVVFEKTPAPEGLKDLIISSKNRLEANADFVKALGAAALPMDRANEAKLKTELAAMKLSAENEARTLAESEEPEVIAAQSKAAAAWFEQQLAASQLSEADRTEAQSLFAGYCQAKIWEFGTSVLATKVNYAARPSPFEICESYYQANGFFDGSSGTCSPDRPALESGGNYFRCLWLEGVLKTVWYASLGDTNLSKIRPWIESDREELRLGLTGKWYATPTATEATDMPAGMLENKFFPAVTQLKVSPGLKFPHSTSPLLTAFRLMPQPAPEIKKPFVARDTLPGKIISFDSYAFETREDSHAETMAVDENLRFMSPLFEQIIYMGARIAPGTSTFCRSIADRRFHRPLPNQTLPATISHGEALAPYREAFFKYPLTEAAKTKIAAKEAEISATALTIRDKITYLRGLEGVYFSQTEQGISFVNKGGVAQAFLTGFDLHIARRADEIGVYVSLPVSDVPEQELGLKAACRDMNTEQPSPCSSLFPRTNSPLDTNDTKFTFNKTNGLITLEYPLANPKLLGFEHRPRSEGANMPFNDFEESELATKRIRFELYPNRVHETLEILTGKVFILNQAGEKIDEGNVILSETYDGTALTQ